MIAGLLVLLGPGQSLAADDPAQVVKTPTQSRPFPVVEFRLGDVPLLLPKDWVDSIVKDRVDSKLLYIHRGSTPFINFANANHLRQPRSTHFEVPPLSHFAMQETAQGLPATNLRASKAEWDRRRPDRHPDQDGFWQWKPGEYALVEPRHARPFDQPLIVECTRSLRPQGAGERRCTVFFYWTLATGVTYDFYDTDVPPSQWVDLDQRVIELLQFLDGREPWPR
jgi:hypothetical protein